MVDEVNMYAHWQHSSICKQVENFAYPILDNMVDEVNRYAHWQHSSICKQVGNFAYPIVDNIFGDYDRPWDHVCQTPNQPTWPLTLNASYVTVGIDLCAVCKTSHSYPGYQLSRVFYAGFVGEPFCLYVCATWPDLCWHPSFMRLVLVLFHVQDKSQTPSDTRILCGHLGGFGLSQVVRNQARYY
jgi:hypothetical protein